MRSKPVSSCALPLLVGVLFAALPAAALAHEKARDSGSMHADSWAEWPAAAPEVILPALAVAALYLAGLRRRAGRSPPVWRHISFFSGLAAILAALASPLDVLAEHSLVMHQLQHLLLAGLGPMLLMLAAPQTLLAAGMPAALSGGVLAPFMTSHTVRLLSRMLASATGATLLLVGTLYFWHIPSVQDLAVLDDPLHYTMHVSMLLAGLLFFWRMFDPRPPPLGTSYAARFVMGWIATSAGLPLGAYLALKNRVLYAAYDWKGRLWDLDALQDETLGGLVMWIPGGIVYAVALLAVIRLWGARDERVEALRRRGFVSAEPARPLHSRNRALAVRLAFIALAVAVTVVAIASLNQVMS